MKDNEIRFCKNKECNKQLPNGYNHKYCESCRTKHIQNIKNVALSSLAVVMFIGGAVASVFGENNNKNA